MATVNRLTIFSARAVFVTLLTAIALGAGAASASAATLFVSTTGTDSGTCGPNPEPACLTLAQAVTNSASGDTISIGPGTFPVTNSIRPGAKSLTIEGQGPTQTILDGGNSNAYTLDAMIWFASTGTTSVVRNLGFANIGRRAVSSNRWAIVVQPSPSNAANAANLTVENVRVTTGNPPVGQNEIAVMAANNNGTVVIDGLETDNLTGNHILTERQRGPVTVRNSTFVRNTAGTIIYDMLHGGPTWNSTGLHLFENNTFTATAAIRVVGGWDFGWNPTTSAYPAGVTITGNTVTSPSIVNTGAAISASNSASTGTPTDGQIANLQITNNRLTGYNGNGNGVVITGQINGSTTSGNEIRGFQRGVYLTRFAPVNPPYSCAGSPPNPCPPAPHQPINTTVVRNQIVGNTAGLVADPSGTIGAQAENNWWGCNEGPGQSGCDTISQPGSDVDGDPWAVLTLTPANLTLTDTQSTTTTAAITTNSDDDAISGFLFDGTDIGFSGTSGTVTPAPAPTTNSAAAPTFQSNSAAGRSVTTTYDNESLTHTWPDYDETDPVVTILTPVDGSVVNSPDVVLTFTVSDNLDPNPICSPTDGSNVTLTEGMNTIVVTCTDYLGNVGSDSVTVQLDTQPPVVNIVTPEDNTTVADNVATTTLTYQVGDFGDPSPNCTPANNSVIPLVVGLNTIVVTCTDAAGNVGTDTVKVTRLAPVPLDPLDVLPSCARDIVITNVVIKGSKYSQITGMARTKFAGQTVRLNYRPSGTRTVGRAVVRADGTWSALVRRPSSPAVGSNRARYRALIAGQSTSWIKLSRRLVTSRIVYRDGKLDVSGRVIRPTAPGRRLVVTRSDLCGSYSKIGTIAVRRDGRFSGSVATDPRADSPVPFIRLNVKVRRGGRVNPNREFTTYSIVRPVPVMR